RLPYRSLGVAASLALVGFIAFAVVSAVHRTSGTFTTVPPPSELHAGEHAPEFTLPRLGGGAPVTSADRGAHALVVNFFASWCTNCVAELRAFSSIAKHPGATRFVGVDTSDPSPREALAQVANAGIPYPVGVDSSGSMADRYLVAALPVTFFVAPNGSIEGEIFGGATATQLRGWLARLNGHTSQEARSR
ncbi:MAG TPA: TlpA disulfide reductase family protein, partial [Acidimicrobiales bacterium]|nr:TlpA disulfide reductase family protein [Acidimicrobiales bacterium]